MEQKLKKLTGSQIQTHSNELTVVQMLRHVHTHSPPLALRRSTREKKLPAKYDGFIIGP